MTWDQIELFADKAGDRIKSDLMSSINSQAIALGVGFSGETKILRDLARELDVPYGGPSTAPASSAGRDVGDAVRSFSEAGNVRVLSHGTNRRRASGQARSPIKRVPRRTPKD